MEKSKWGGKECVGESGGTAGKKVLHIISILSLFIPIFFYDMF